MQWLPIPRFPNYAISDQGDLRRILTYQGNPTCKPCKPRLKHGYTVAHLSQNGVVHDVPVHRMVWEAFRGKIPAKMQINHLNGIRSDNRVENLEVCTVSENILHKFRVLKCPAPNNPSPGSKHGQSKLREEDIPEIRQLYANGLSQSQIGEMFDVSQVLIGRIVRGEAWKHVPL